MSKPAKQPDVTPEYIIPLGEDGEKHVWHEQEQMTEWDRPDCILDSHLGRHMEYLDWCDQLSLKIMRETGRKLYVKHNEVGLCSIWEEHYRYKIVKIEEEQEDAKVQKKTSSD